MAVLKSAIVNIHIPKTAGSNFRYQMANLLPPVHNNAQLIGIDGAGLGGGSYYDHLRTLAKTALPALSDEYLQFVSGHFRYRDVADVIAPSRAKLILTTVLRDPIDRTVSDYVYCLSDAHPSKDAFTTLYPDFDSYLNNAGQLNKQLDYLRPHDNASVEETLACVLEHFDFVGINERFDADFAKFAMRLGLPIPKRTQQNKGTNKSLADRLRLDHHDKLSELLAPEQALYDGLFSVDWGDTAFDVVHAQPSMTAPSASQSAEIDEDERLRHNIRAMRPWHHNIALNAAVSTGIDGAAETMDTPITITSPAEIFAKFAMPLLPDGMAQKSFLDCGCNAGGYCFAAKDAGAARTFGFDVRDHWIDQARFLAQNREKNSDGMQFDVADLLDLKKSDEMFDVTWFSGLLYHLPDPVHGLKIAADKTRELLFINTAVQPLKEGEEQKRSLLLKHEGVESPMSGVHHLSWLPGGPAVLRDMLAWMGFPETHVLFWNKQVTRNTKARPGRLGLVAARTPGRLDVLKPPQTEID